MDQAQFEREKEYGAAVAIASRLLRRELITQDEYRNLKTALVQKYRPEVSSKHNSASNPIPKQKMGG